MGTPFKASAQYNDYIGTAAADCHNSRADLAEKLQQEGLKTESESLIGFSIYLGEVYSEKICLTAYLHSTNTPLEDIADPVPLKEVEIELSVEEFQGIFKRFNVYLSNKRHDAGVMDNRTYKSV